MNKAKGENITKSVLEKRKAVLIYKNKINLFYNQYGFWDLNANC